MSKIIVAHISVDLDAVSSAWLIKRFRPGWHDAELKFVPAGTTLDNKPPDENPDIAHVDTGLGMFDHHQIKDRHLCAAKRVFQYLEKEGFLKSENIVALSRMIEFIAVIDNFGEIHFSDPTADMYEFMLYQIIEGLKANKQTDKERCEFVFEMLDSVYQTMRNKVRAEEEIKKGRVFQSRWGKALAMETKNEEAMKLALKSGYSLVIRKDPEKGHIRIKTLPDDSFDLTALYEKLKKLDSEATWFLHVSKNMLLNGSSKQPESIPTKLSLQNVVELVQKM